MPRTSRWPFLAPLAALAVACGDDPIASHEWPLVTLDDRPLPTAIDLDFDALRGARIAVGREPMHASGDSVGGLYVVNGSAGTIAGYFGGSFWGDPVISPDGTRVSFRTWSGVETHWDVFVTALGDADASRVSALPGNTEGPPAWSPDGQSVYHTTYLGGRCCDVELRRAPVSGEVERILVIPAMTGVTLDQWSQLSVSSRGWVAMTHGPRLDLVELVVREPFTIHQAVPGADQFVEIQAPTWAPDGNHLAFLEVVRSVGAGTTPEVLVRRLNPLTEEVVTLATLTDLSSSFTPAGYTTAYSACWSADGGTVLFSAPTPDGFFGLYSVPADGGAVATVAADTGWGYVSVSCF